jgi:hypothetical protein
VWVDSLTVENGGVCDEPGAVGEVGWPASGAIHGRIREGSGMSRGSLTGRAERGASVQIARGPGEYQTKTLTKPVFMIENIRTSRYDRCSDMFGP